MPIHRMTPDTTDFAPRRHFVARVWASLADAVRTHGAKTQHTPPLARELPWVRIAVAFASSRILIWIVAGLGLLGVRKGQFLDKPDGIRDWFVRWDANWYLDVVQHGYWFVAPGKPTNVVFLPLYPRCIKFISGITGATPVVAAYLVSITGLWIACVLLGKMVLREWGDRELAVSAVEFMLFSPVSFFFSAPYSESIFLPLVIACIAFSRTRRWWIAGFCGLLASLTRIVGLMLIVPLAWEWLEWMAASRPPRRNAVAAACAVVMPLVGFALYAAFMYMRFNDPFAYFHGQQAWGRHLTWFWGAFAKHSFWSLAPFYRVWFSAAFFTSWSFLLIGVLLRFPPSFAILGVTFGIVYVSGSGVEALPRYFSVLFPLYAAAALLTRKWPSLRVPLLAMSVALLSLSTVLFVNGYWFT